MRGCASRRAVRSGQARICAARRAGARLERLANHSLIAEGAPLASVDLVILVTFACNQDDIGVACACERTADGSSTIVNDLDLRDIGDAREDLGGDLCRILASRVVI